MIDKLKQHLDSITPEKLNKEIEDIQQEFNADSPTMEEFLDLEKMEQKLDTQLESETTESLNEWLDNKRSQFLDSCDMEDCPHCAYELQEEFDDDDMLTDDEWLIREKHKQTIEFGEWLISSNWSCFDSTEKSKVYVNLLITDALLNMEQVFEIFLKEKCK